jgi:hypothetical protein
MSNARNRQPQTIAITTSALSCIAGFTVLTLHGVRTLDDVSQVGGLFHRSIDSPRTPYRLSTRIQHREALLLGGTEWGTCIHHLSQHLLVNLFAMHGDGHSGIFPNPNLVALHANSFNCDGARSTGRRLTRIHINAIAVAVLAHFPQRSL